MSNKKLQTSDLFLTNRGADSYTSPYGDVKTNILDSHLIQDKVEPTPDTYPDLVIGTIWVNTSVSPMEILVWDGTQWVELVADTPVVDPNPPVDISISPPVSGSGTIDDPYVLSTVTSYSSGGTVYTNETITISNQPGGTVFLPQTLTGGARFTQEAQFTDPAGSWSGQFKYVDTPNSTSGATYTADLKIGTSSVYFTWEVAQVANQTNFGPESAPTASPTTVDYGVDGKYGKVSATWADGVRTLSATDLVFSINGAVLDGADKTIVDGDTIEVGFVDATVSAAATGDTITGSLVSSDGVYFNEFSMVKETKPLFFEMAELVDQEFSTVVTSGNLPLLGINAPSTISLTSSTLTDVEISVNGAAFTTGPWDFNPGDPLQVRGTTGGDPLTAYNAVFDVGGLSVTWEVTTVDADPNIVQPQITGVPTNGAIDVELPNELTTSAYDGIFGAGNHDSTDWEIYEATKNARGETSEIVKVQTGPDGADPFIIEQSFLAGLSGGWGSSFHRGEGTELPDVTGTVAAWVNTTHWGYFTGSRLTNYLMTSRDNAPDGNGVDRPDHSSSALDPDTLERYKHQRGWRHVLIPNVRLGYPLNDFSGYVAEYYFIQDRDDLTHSEFMDEMGYPKQWVGDVGEHGFYLDFSDNSTVDSIGLDRSGKDNHWQVTCPLFDPGVIEGDFRRMYTDYAWPRTNNGLKHFRGPSLIFDGHTSTSCQPAKQDESSGNAQSDNYHIAMGFDNGTFPSSNGPYEIMVWGDGGGNNHRGVNIKVYGDTRKTEANHCGNANCSSNPKPTIDAQGRSPDYTSNSRAVYGLATVTTVSDVESIGSIRVDGSRYHNMSMITVNGDVLVQADSGAKEFVETYNGKNLRISKQSPTKSGNPTEVGGDAAASYTVFTGLASDLLTSFNSYRTAYAIPTEKPHCGHFYSGKRYLEVSMVNGVNRIGNPNSGHSYRGGSKKAVVGVKHTNVQGGGHENSTHQPVIDGVFCNILANGQVDIYDKYKNNQTASEATKLASTSGSPANKTFANDIGGGTPGADERFVITYGFAYDVDNNNTKVYIDGQLAAEVNQDLQGGIVPFIYFTENSMYNGERGDGKHAASYGVVNMGTHPYRYPAPAGYLPFEDVSTVLTFEDNTDLDERLFPENETGVQSDDAASGLIANLNSDSFTIKLNSVFGSFSENDNKKLLGPEIEGLPPGPPKEEPPEDGYVLTDQSLADTVNLESYDLTNPPLAGGKVYYSRAKFRDDTASPNTVESEWTPWHEMTTEN